ncbi:right-handed parallel beta-helix repeat-containing protein [Halobacterium bonnevillei]|uniref:Copper ABC transporter substrate-binding protein n=1 Tax=Halobacterium bonnevillei TaxID=2692200 RepID=A0A6B0SKH4_9EURY|nr:right-handed parallel beta-helix repeat-containing protein [Halobacterium bonnevillei]MXR21707.1 copper ABC transporter substrate-binding protein [Halobacterium bonnevillei]
MLGRSLIVAVVVVLLVLSGSLVVPIESTSHLDPAPFEDTFRLGLTGAAVQEADQRGLSIPRVEVFYSNYEYVVGFNGVESFVAEQARTGHQRQFGRPVAVFVTDFADANASLTDEGYLTATRYTGFTPADDTFVVVDSRARLPSGPVAVPFSDREAAGAFAEEYDGRVVPWAAVSEHVDAESPLTRDRFRSTVQNRSAWADAASASARDLRDRPTSVVVGEDAPTLGAAVEAAAPNTTIEVPAGTYRTDNVTVDKPVTIAGAGPDTTIRGDGNGTVVRLDASRVALVDLAIDGVGDVGSRRAELNASELEDLEWSENVELAYGQGDAAVKLRDANRSLVSGVHIETPASGVIVLNSSGTTIRDVDVTVTEGTRDGFMGLVSMYDPIVVEDSRFEGGRDAVYTHRADDVVVRDNAFRDGRFGVHLMYTSGALIRNNTAREEGAGIIVMTRPTGNMVVGNDVRASGVGVSTAGSHSYYAENVLAGNVRGLDVIGYQSLVERNTVVDNDVGLRATSGLPTNLVTDNDVVDNDDLVRSGLGPLRVWTAQDEGNYWGPMPATDADADGYYERSFRPTGAVDARLYDAPGAWTLARSPAIELIRGVQDTVPGLRSTGVLDTSPRVTPARPDVLAAVRAARNTTEATA